MLGNLITRHIAEFDRTVKTYGGELVERLGQRTQDVSEAMRNYVDTFDQRVTGHTTELNTTMNSRLSQFEETLDQRFTGLSQSLTDGGKEVVGAIDKRISEVAGTITARGRVAAGPRAPPGRGQARWTTGRSRDARTCSTSPVRNSWRSWSSSGWCGPAFGWNRPGSQQMWPCRSATCTPMVVR